MVILCDNNFANNIGKEFQVNSYTISAQLHPRIANLQNDVFIIVWDSSLSDGSAAGISGQLLYQNGTKIGNEFQINSYVTSAQSNPDVKYLQDNRFIVAWESSMSDGSDVGIAAQLFYSNGTKIGSEFQVNSYTISAQLHPRIANLQNDVFIIVWDSSLSDGSDSGIAGQLFYNNGTKIGKEFQINSYVTSAQSNPDVKYLQDDRFIVVWESSLYDGSDVGIAGQLFYINGTKIGREFQVNSYVTSAQLHPRIENLQNDSFIIVWDSSLSDGSDSGIAGQLFYHNGTKIGKEFQINSYVRSAQSNPDVKYLQDDRFIVVWESSLYDGSDVGIAGQLFYINGTKIGREFQVNSYVTSAQLHPRVENLQTGTFIVVWDSSLSDGSDSGIAAKIFDSSCINDFLVTTTAPTTITSMPSTTTTTNIPSTETLATTTTTTYTRIPTIETPTSSMTSEASDLAVNYNIMLAVGAILFLYLE